MSSLIDYNFGLSVAQLQREGYWSGEDNIPYSNSNKLLTASVIGDKLTPLKVIMQPSTYTRFYFYYYFGNRRPAAVGGA